MQTERKRLAPPTSETSPQRMPAETPTSFECSSLKVAQRTGVVDPVDTHECSCGFICDAYSGGICASEREEVLR